MTAAAATPTEASELTGDFEPLPVHLAEFAYLRSVECRPALKEGRELVVETRSLLGELRSLHHRVVRQLLHLRRHVLRGYPSGGDNKRLPDS